jgi:hypothetical protein
LPKNPETLSPILMSIYKVYVSTSVIFRALWNHLGHPLPTHRGSPIMQETSKILNLSWKVLLGAIVAWGMQIWDLDVLIHLPSPPQ